MAESKRARPDPDSPTLADGMAGVRTPTPGESSDIIPPPGPSGSDSPTLVSPPPPKSAPSKPSGGTPSSATLAEPDLFPLLPVLAPGTLLGGRYQILAVLGQGGMGAVYKAKDVELDRRVALKVIRPELAGNASIIQRFKQELILARQITHKNVVRIFDLGEAEGIKFITMEYIEGEDLRSLLQKRGKVPAEEAVEVMQQVCRALEAAHAEGVIHRDLKPQNIMRDSQGRVVVMDFGLARSLESSGMTQTGALVGTMEYMSPEQALGGELDQRSDLFTLGLIFYELLSGKVPYKADTALASLLRRTQERAVPLAELDPTVPQALSNVVSKCLERDSNLRYQSVSEILDDLQAGRTPTLSSTRQVSLPQAAVPILQRRILYLAGALLVAILAAGLALPPVRNLLFHSSGARSSNVPALAQGKYVAVLPFRVLGERKALGYVAEGLLESLSAQLFQLKSVHIASTEEVLKLGDNESLDKVAHKLGVNLIVQGTVQGSGDKIRITANLEDVLNQRRLWTGEFSGVSGDLLTLEDQIYNQLIPALELKPSAEELARGTAHPTENAEAYDLYLKGREYMRKEQEVKNVQAAIDLYGQALKKDPGFALAYTGLADASLSMYRHSKESFWSEKAMRAAQQAQRLNDAIPEAHFSLGSVYTATGKTAEAIAELQRAQQLAPNSDEAYRRLGSVYMNTGRKEEAVEAYKKAIEANPYYWLNHNALGEAYYNFGQNQEAAASFRKVIELEPENSIGYDNLGVVYLRMERWNECIPNFEKALQIQPYFATYSNLATAYFFLKRYDDAVKMFEKAVAMNPNEQVAMGNLADAYRWSGQKQQALATYDKAIALAYKELAVNPRSASTMGFLALYYAKKGDTRRGLDFVRRARSIEPADVSLVYIESVVDCLAGKKLDALTTLRQALQRGYPLPEAQNDPELKDIQSLPDFARLVSEFGTTTK